MAITNRDRVGKALDLLNAGLVPFVERELKSVHGDKWEEIAREGQPPERGKKRKAAKPHMDTHALLAVMWNEWNRVFNRTLGNAERSLVSELRDVRNKWAHQEAFGGNDAHRALDSMGRLLTAVSAPEASEVEQMRMDLLRVQFDEQRRHEMRKVSFAPTEGKPQGGLKPWREVVTPHPDVASGRYQQAEFAADLWQVYQNEGSDEYKHPTEFFRRTFITEGLRGLLHSALKRLAGVGGDPVVELQTNFGGGKTHSMLTLWHVFSGTPASELPGVEELLKEGGVEVASGVKRAVLVGTKISPGQPHKKPDGTVVRTLWGELAWQLGGKEGYKLVKDADQTATNPGDNLKELFNKFSPCLILIDEWVAYARQLREEADLPAGTFDTQFTFAQNISECAKAAKQTMLVVSVPSSDNEIGGQWGQQALARIKNAIGRVESSWRPASPDEGFEIVRRRLFQPLAGDQFVARDAVARAFSELYGSQHQEFPSECREANYERRIKMAYPIHPELFDRLYNDWSTLDKFQRTRGVLRLMAAVIHSLWERQDGNLLIMPATVPVDDPSVQFELTRYMEDHWVPVIEKDVDGSNSLPLTLDRENPNLGRYSASRRVSRTIYMGSAPIQKAANRGIEDRQVKLGCVQPGETVATFGDALRRLTDRATYLYVDGRRYWYSTQPTVARLAEDRAGQLHEDNVTDEIVRRLRDESRTRGDFAKVHACAPSSDVPDEREARLVVLGPEYPHTAKDLNSAARKEAASILECRGSSPRNYRNTLVFLAADGNRLKELGNAARQFLAWTSIWDERETLNLDPFQTKQADTKCKNADETVEARIPETFQWLIVPGQSDPKGDIEWTDIRLQGQDALAKRASKKLKNEELLMVQLGDVRLRHELDRVPLWRKDHVGVKQLAEDVAKYLYLPRMRDQDVLLEAIREGVSRLTWESETFAYAEGWDEQRKRYKGLRGGQAIRVLIDSECLLVKPDIAAVQIESERQAQTGRTGTGTGPDTGGTQTTVAGQDTETTGVTTGGTGVVTPPPMPRRFYGAVKLDSVRLSRDADKIAQEIVQHLTALVGTEVEVTLEIHAAIPDGASPELVRTITENCCTLRFENYGFEER
ncbi:MAG: Swt1 family HEPN domain-containing protein [Planctomycetota bacterium]